MKRSLLSSASSPVKGDAARRAVLAVTIVGVLSSSIASAAPPNLTYKQDPTTPIIRREGSTPQPASAVPSGGTAGRTLIYETRPLPGAGGRTLEAASKVTAPVSDAPRAQIRRGTGQTINTRAASAPLPNHRSSSGPATFNFEGAPLHAVVKAILGDLLNQNFIIAPGVQGTVTISTTKSVSPADAMSLLEQVLSENNARMVYSGGRYNIIPADRVMQGNVAPRTGSAANARGFEVRTVPLRFVSATEMEKILKPYARTGAVVSVDNGRNVISIGGSKSELENYLRTIEIFDVDWLKGMSVGVFPLESGKASRVVSDLEKVFGEQSKSPVAGMFRFMALDGANAVLVITPQASYLDNIQDWLDRIDSAGGDVQLFSHELKFVKAKELADRLAEVFGGSRGGTGSGGGAAPTLMPGLESVEMRDGGMGGDSVAQMSGGKDGGGDTGGSDGGGLGSGMSLGAGGSGSGGGNGSVTLEVQGSRVGVSAVAETNTLLVRATPQAWRSIKDVIERLDVMPLQVHIEAQVVEVQLGGELEYGVNWFFENAVNAAGSVPTGGNNIGGYPGGNLPSAAGRNFWGDIAGALTGNGGGWTFLGKSAAAVVTALDKVSDLRVLQTPSVVVKNNGEATLNVGDRIPIESVTVTPGTGTGGTSEYSQVQYLDTGVILKVRPRVTKDGMVFMDIVQEVSQAGDRTPTQRNVTISTRKLKTEAAIQSGDTIMLAGLIKDEDRKGSAGVPGLSRIPVVGGLFGKQTKISRRSETIVLITPKVIRNPDDARKLTDEYGSRFRALNPIDRNKPKKGVQVE